MLLFYTPWKPLGFLMFSGGIAKQHWAVMSYSATQVPLKFNFCQNISDISNLYITFYLLHTSTFTQCYLNFDILPSSVPSLAFFLLDRECDAKLSDIHHIKFRAKVFQFKILIQFHVGYEPTTLVAFWQLIHLGTWCTVIYCWYQWTKKSPQVKQGG